VGAFIVAKENLGTLSGLIAGASLLVDYILTVSCRLRQGSRRSRRQWSDAIRRLAQSRVILCLFFIAFITVANLRGVREAGAMFAAPSYAFIFSFLALIIYGLVRYF
jgi:amino acid transporter